MPVRICVRQSFSVWNIAGILGRLRIRGDCHRVCGGGAPTAAKSAQYDECVEGEMSGFWDMLRHPPSWIVAILLVWMVGEILNKAVKLPPGGLVAVMEFFVVFVLGAVFLHVAFGETLQGNSKDGMTIFFVVAFVVFALLSMVVYVIDKGTPKA
jgi:hypothetical protein